MAGTRRVAKPYSQNVLLEAVRESLDKGAQNLKQDFKT